MDKASHVHTYKHAVWSTYKQHKETTQKNRIQAKRQSHYSRHVNLYVFVQYNKHYLTIIYYRYSHRFSGDMFACIGGICITLCHTFFRLSVPHLTPYPVSQSFDEGIGRLIDYGGLHTAILPKIVVHGFSYSTLPVVVQLPLGVCQCLSVLPSLTPRIQ